MKTASVQDLHSRTSELVREAESGTVILIERRGQPVAELRPISKESPKQRLPEMRKLWRRHSAVTTDSGRFLEEDR